MNEGRTYEVEIYQEKGYNRITYTFFTKADAETFIEAIESGRPNEVTIITLTIKVHQKPCERPVEAF